MGFLVDQVIDFMVSDGIVVWMDVVDGVVVACKF